METEKEEKKAVKYCMLLLVWNSSLQPTHLGISVQI